MKKRSLLMAASMLVALLVATTSTLAFLQDTAADHNIMTLGSVTIVQHEYERATNEDGTYKTDTIDGQNSYVLQGFTQNKPLVPIVGDPNEPGDSPLYAGWDDTTVRMSQVNSYGGMQVFAGKNAQDKFVTVENTGASPAYVRTLVAIEVGSANGALVGKSYHSGSWAQTDLGVIKVGDTNYKVFSYVYQGAQLSNGSWRHEGGILPAGETTYPNLSQIYIKSKATNEDLIAIDGNGNGKLDVLVLSQAIQADGFASADAALTAGFGEANATNAAEWLGGVPMIQVVNSADELAAAMAKGGNILLNADIDLGSTQIVLEAGVDATLDLGGHTLTGKHASGDHYAMFNIKNGASLTVSGEGEVKATTACTENNRSLALFLNAGELNINGGSYNLTDSTTGKTWIIATLVDNRTSNASCNAKLTINGGEFSVGGNAVNLFRNYPQQGGTATIIMNNGTFKGLPENETTFIWNQEAGSYLGELYFNGGSFDANVVYEDYNGQADIHIADGVTIHAYSGNN